MADSSYVLMKSIYKKFKEGFRISNTPEFYSLVLLCASDVRTTRLSASKCVFYLWKWNIIETSVTLNLLRSLACETKNIDGIMLVLFNITSNVCEAHDASDLPHDLFLFQESTSHIISSNDNASLIILSLFDQLEINHVIINYNQILQNILFGKHPHRSLVWLNISKRVHKCLLRNFIFLLQLNTIENSVLFFNSINTMDISYSEVCLYLTVVIKSMLSHGHNPQEAVKSLKSCIIKTPVEIQSLVLLTLLSGVEAYSEVFMHIFFELCEWFVKNAEIWKEILWMIIACFLSFVKNTSVYPDMVCKSSDIIKAVLTHYHSQRNFDLDSIEIKSVILKYIVRRYESLYQSFLIMRLLQEFKGNEDSLLNWLKKLSNAPDPQFKLLEMLLGKYFLTGSSEVRWLCLTIFEKWKINNLYFYIYHLNNENDPNIVVEILKILSSKKTSKDNFIIQNFIRLSSQTEYNFNLKMNLLVVCCKDRFEFINEIPSILKEHSNFSNALSLAVLVKTISNVSNIYFEELISYCNIMTNSARESGGNFATSLIIDSISCMCEKGILDVSILWDKLLGIVAGDNHPAVHASVCNFLGRLPLLMKNKEDKKNVLYKSARVLWYFANNSAMDNKLALRCLKNYDLDIFDTTFLEEQCHDHLNLSEDSVIERIKGDCWIHMIKDLSYVELFENFINKCKSKARFRENYSSFFDGIVNYLSSHTNENEEDISKCLKLLCADWVNIPAGKDLRFLKFYLYHPSKEIKELSILVVLNFSTSVESASFLFESFLSENNYSENENAVMCLLPGNLLSRNREINEKLLLDGMLFGLQSSFADPLTGEPFDLKIEKVLQSNELWTSVSDQRILIRVLLGLWRKVDINDKVFKCVTKLLSILYGHPLLEALPNDLLTEEMCRKYIYLGRELALLTKSLHCFDISVGLKHPSMQKDVIDNLLFVLKNISQEKRSRNIKWLLRILCMCAMNGNDYLCQILVYGMTFLSGVNFLSTSDTLRDSVNHFPLAVSVICGISGKRNNISMTLNEIIKKKGEFHACFIEAFKITLMCISDESPLPQENKV